MRKSSYIIGGGISGLVWQFYHPEFEIITPEVGGQYTRSHLVWLHDSPETRKLLRDVGYSNPEQYIKRSYMGYYHNGFIHDYQDKEINEKITQRKMNEWDNKEPIEFKSREVSMSIIGGSNNYMNTLNVDLVDLIQRLSKNARIIAGFVSDITDTQIVYTEQFTKSVEMVQYNKLVSTVAAPFFWKMYRDDIHTGEFRCMPITNIITSVRPALFDDRYEMIYYDMSVPFSRISHLGDKYAIEITGAMEQSEFEKLYPDLPVEDYFVVKQGRIFEEENLEPQDNIIFSGRFAQWKFGITTEHVIAQALNYKSNSQSNEK